MIFGRMRRRAGKKDQGTKIEKCHESGPERAPHLSTYLHGSAHRPAKNLSSKEPIKNPRGAMLIKTQEESIGLVYGGKNQSENREGETKGNATLVSFSSVSVYYHSTRVGDHLDCDGPPLALGDFTDSEIHENLEQYEQHRPYIPREDSRINAVDRLEILENQGFSVQAIMDCLQQAEKDYMMQASSCFTKNVFQRSVSRLFRRRVRR
ncbi:hypothetical protein ACA910_008987 [Epithemia clementina (nom. ined.)]